MKNFTLTLALMIAYSFVSFAQNVPCPDIQSHGITNVSSTASSTSAKLYFYASGDVSAQKGVKVQVYVNSVASANTISETCFIIPANTASTYYETPVFTGPSASPVIYVITRTTASDGTCQGGTCGITITVPFGALPIKISSFNASRNNNTVSLNWATASESNAKEFVIERKTDKGFEAVATVAAANHESGSAYSYTDKNTFKGISQYRLKMIDIDGKSAYSIIKSVKAASAVSDFTVFPNPSFGNTKISVTDVNENNDVQLIDNAGRIVKTVSMSNKSSIELLNLQKGIYLVRIINKSNGDFVTKKLTVVN